MDGHWFKLTSMTGWVYRCIGHPLDSIRMWLLVSSARHFPHVFHAAVSCMRVFLCGNGPNNKSPAVCSPFQACKLQGSNMLQDLASACISTSKRKQKNIFERPTQRFSMVWHDMKFPYCMLHQSVQESMRMRMHPELTSMHVYTSIRTSILLRESYINLLVRINENYI